MKKTQKFLVVILSAIMVFSLAFTVSANTDAGFEEYAGYQFTGTDPWGGTLSVTVRNVENWKLNFTYTDDFGTEMIYKELSALDINPQTHMADFYIEGNYSGNDHMIYNYGGTIELNGGKVIITYKFGETVTQSSEGDSNSRQVDALEAGKKVVTLSKHIPSGGTEGWTLVNGKWYYSKNGEMVTGWLFDGNAWYYMDYSGEMVTGWVFDGNAWYYMDYSGAMVTGWLLSGNTWYYMNYSGAMVTGWLFNGNSWYYLDPSGAMVTGEAVIDGISYFFNSNGAWIG